VLGNGHPGGARSRLGAIHEGRGLLEEGWVYFAGCGGSCSTHNPWPVVPEARGVVGWSEGVLGWRCRWQAAATSGECLVSMLRRTCP